MSIDSLWIEKLLDFAKEHLVKYRGSYRSLGATAKVVSRNEALFTLKHIERQLKAQQLQDVNFREAFNRLFSLYLRTNKLYSPFNPFQGFYLWHVANTGPLEIEALGRNITEVVFNVFTFVIKSAYNVEIVDKQYTYALLKEDQEIGTIYFAKTGKNREKCLIAKIQKDKLVAHYYNTGLLVYIRLSCPQHIKRAVLPELIKLREMFSTLCISKPTKFLQNIKIALNHK